ncbi:GIY-YIG nuclease family protein [Candidatus Uhrbacteria bacterium]|nr:GIY-YIG nuclease family protein [Candidatus Uhrbacteria bacterium]
MLRHIHHVYILFSLRDRKLYVGYSTDIQRRLEEHQSGKVPANKNRFPLKLIYSESYLTATEAKRREKYLKGGNGRAQLKVQLSDTLKSCGYKCL